MSCFSKPNCSITGQHDLIAPNAIGRINGNIQQHLSNPHTAKLFVNNQIFKMSSSPTMIRKLVLQVHHRRAYNFFMQLCHPKIIVATRLDVIPELIHGITIIMIVVGSQLLNNSAYIRNVLFSCKC